MASRENPVWLAATLAPVRKFFNYSAVQRNFSGQTAYPFKEL